MLDRNNAAALIEKLKLEHTEIRAYPQQDSPDAHTVWLRVGVQHFCVTPQFVDTAEEAEFMQEQLAVALANLVDGHQKG
jgi:hypothetical protein